MNLIQVSDRIAQLPIIRNLVRGTAKRLGTGTANASDAQIIMQIIKEFKDLSYKDIQNWRLAVAAAEDPFYPRWAPLQDLYDYLEPDAQLGTSRDIRAANTLGIPGIIRSKKTGEELPDKTNIFKNKEWFFNFKWEFLDTVLRGNSIAQLKNPATMDFTYLPRRNFVPQQDFMLNSAYATEGVSIYDPAFNGTIIAVKYKHKLGILNDIVPNLIWKKNSRQAWQEFAEKFGIPPIWATSEKSDKKTIDRIEMMLKQLGEAATAVLPKGTTVQVQDQATKGDPYNVYLKQIELDDQAIAKRLLGGTMITDNGASRSQSEVHERTLKEVIGLFDKMILLFVINDYLLPLMARYGHPFTDDDEFVFDESIQLSLTDVADIVQKVSSAFDIDADWITKMGIPVKPKAQPAQSEPQGNFKPTSIAPAAALGVKGVTLPSYPRACCAPGQVTASFSSDLLEELSEVLLNEVWEGKDTLTTEVLKSIAGYRQLLDGLFDNWTGRLELAYDVPATTCLAFMEYNLFEFSRLKEKANVSILNDLARKYAEGQDFVGYRNEALQYLKNPDVNWQRTEFNQTIAVGQNAADYNRFMAERETVTNYVQWATVGDSHVRPTHAIMNGKIFRLDDPKGLSMWPPKEWGCRCILVQYLGKPPKELLLSNDEGLQILGIEPGSKWDVNRGQIQQVFTANEMYAKEIGLNSETAKLDFKSFGKKSLKDTQDLPALKLDSSINESNVGELFKPEKGKTFMGFDDYTGRKMMLPKGTFEKHTSGKYVGEGEQRDKLFPHVADILNAPDEVYFTKYGKKDGKTAFQTNYVKFFNDNTMLVVNTGTGSEGVQINTWYKAKVDESKVRQGYLIHSKK